MKPVLLMLIPLPERYLGPLRERFDLVYAPTPSARAEALMAEGGRVEAVLTNGSVGLSAEQIAALPRLGFVSVFGAGYENVAVEAARGRGVVLASGAGTNDDCVADHALALLLATVRAIPGFDRHVRAGRWRDALPMPPQLAGKRLGLLGLGAIGRKIARRGEAFDLAVGYHNRSPRGDVPFRSFESPVALAEWCDFLVVATPGGPSTRHLVDASVLHALGPAGYLVNIARGSVVDTAALAAALEAGQLAGAGLDVYESEPAPPESLQCFENVVLTPHVAGWSPESMQASLQCFLDNAGLYFSGRPVRTPI